jgi:hypothetical protein
MVMVQTGYRRVEPLTGDLVSTMFGWSGVNWYPGVQLFGEGIFIDIPDDHPRPSGPRADAWAALAASATDADEAERAHPVQVWWHSLSHRLLRTLSIDSGYSSAAIRERTYLSANTGDPTGGVLLFTVQRLLASETSCEHRNLGLDRLLLLDNLP